MLKAILWNTIGGGAIKALVGGVASGAVASGTMLAGVCDLQTLGQQVGGVAGAALVGYVMTWIAPKNAMFKANKPTEKQRSQGLF